MPSNRENLALAWRERLQQESPSFTETEIETLIKWLLGKNPSIFDNLSPSQLEQFKKGCDYRYNKFKRAYWGLAYPQAYNRLIDNLSRIPLVNNTIRNWMSSDKEARKVLREIIEEVVQEILCSSQYINRQMEWIGTITTNSNLRNALLFTDLEEYCLRPINNQNILIGRIINYFKKEIKKGVKNIPKGTAINVVPDTFINEEDESSFNLVDTKAIAQYQDNQNYQEITVNRLKVQEELETYLVKKLGEIEGLIAVEWLNLHMQGYSAKSISKITGIEINTVYRIREKVVYHANNFALNDGSPLVNDWLEIGVDKNFGLTPTQYIIFREQLTERQRKIFSLLQEGLTLEEIGKRLSLQKTLLKKEWGEIYTKGKNLRSPNSVCG